MRFVHMADIHFDTPFTLLNSKENFGNKRRLEQRQAFLKTINYIKTNKISYLFICGDLYDHLYIRKTTIDFINKQFINIPETKIFIIPGNHDPLLKNSYYKNYNWSNNVYILNSELNFCEFNDIDIYGFGFDDFKFNKNIIQNIKIKNKNKLNILLMHADLNATNSSYNPVSQATIKNLGFDYIALGHIHKRQIINNNIVYPGSTISLGFDELGEHGILDVNLSKKDLDINFVPVDSNIFEILNLDISKMQVEEELIEYLNTLKLDENNFFEIHLTGIHNFEINTNNLISLNNNPRILKIKDLTINNFNINKLLEQNNLKSFFIKELLNKKTDESLSEEDIKSAMEIGLKALEN